MKKQAFAFGARYLLGAFAAVLLAFIGFATQDDRPRFSAWSEPVNLGEPSLGSKAAWFPAISKDELSLYFTTGGLPGYGGYDIYVCQRASVDDPWGPPQNLGPNINTSSNESGPGFSPDGHLMYFASDKPGGSGGTDIYVSRRHNKRDDFGWQTPMNLGSGINTEYNEANPDIFEDDEDTGDICLYFESNRPGGPSPYEPDPWGNGNDIYVSTLQTDETFGPAMSVEGLNSSSRDRTPSIRRDGLEIFFSSDRPGGVGFDLWVSTRPTTSDPWSEPVNLGLPVNLERREQGPSLSWDRTKLYFCSDSKLRPDWRGGWDLYVSTRTKLKGPDKD